MSFVANGTPKLTKFGGHSDSGVDTVHRSPKNGTDAVPFANKFDANNDHDRAPLDIKEGTEVVALTGVDIPRSNITSHDGYFAEDP